MYSYDKNTDSYVNIIDGVTNIEVRLVQAHLCCTTCACRCNLTDGLVLLCQPFKDKDGKAIGVSACDVDGDGNEEVFILNTDAYQGPTTKTSVRLFKHNSGSKTYTDLFTLERNQKARAFAAGRSVACLDRNQDGRYGMVPKNIFCCRRNVLDVEVVEFQAR